MPTSSAGLSFVPNVSIAKSLTNGGTLSITRSPTSMTGDLHDRDEPAISSATPSATIAATTPAIAPSAVIDRFESGSVDMPAVRAPPPLDHVTIGVGPQS